MLKEESRKLGNNRQTKASYGYILNHSFEKIHSDGLLVVSRVDAFAVSLYHAALANASVSNYDNFDGNFQFLFPHDHCFSSFPVFTQFAQLNEVPKVCHV